MTGQVTFLSTHGRYVTGYFLSPAGPPGLCGESRQARDAGALAEALILAGGFSAHSHARRFRFPLLRGFGDSSDSAGWMPEAWAPPSTALATSPKGPILLSPTAASTREIPLKAFPVRPIRLGAVGALALLSSPAQPSWLLV